MLAEAKDVFRESLKCDAMIVVSTGSFGASISLPPVRAISYSECVSLWQYKEKVSAA
jgi:hypothetical protein